MPAYAGTPTAAGTPGTTSNGIALLVQEQRFDAALIEHERVAPLEAHDQFVLARLFGDEVTDRLLIEAFGRGAADVDPLGGGWREVEQARMHEVVVDHHVRRLQTAKSARADQIRRTGPRADEIDNAPQHLAILSAGLKPRSTCHASGLKPSLRTACVARPFRDANDRESLRRRRRSRRRPASHLRRRHHRDFLAPTRGPRARRRAT